MIAQRVTVWKAPTGRWLESGQRFHHRDHPGDWRFIALVEHPVSPYVEAIKVGGNSNVRSLPPDGVDIVRRKVADELA